MTRTVLLGDILEVIIDHRGKTPLKLGGKWSTSGHRALSAKNIEGGKLKNQESIRFVDEKLYLRWMKKDINYGDILLTSEGPMGEIMQWNSGEKIVLSQRLFGLRADKTKVSPNFLYAYLSSPIFKQELEARATGSTVRGIRQAELVKTKLQLPEMKSQKFIGQFVKVLDRKIELNRRMNETLEQIGQTLFKHYFIDGTKSKTWPRGKIGELVELNGGGTPSTKESDFWDGDIAWTSPRDLTGKKEAFLFETDKKITKSGLRKISSGLLPAGTLLLSSRAPIGYIAIAGVPMAINQGYIAFAPGAKLSNSFMYFWLKQNMGRIKGAANGSTFMEISKTSFRNIVVKLPPDDILSQFEEQVKSIFSSMRRKQLETANLVNLRESLLPRLISGKIKV